MKIHPAGAKPVFSAVASLFRVRTLPLAVLVLLTEQVLLTRSAHLCRPGR